MSSIAVMIVDNDKTIVENLIKMIDWEEHGFRVAATAFNGKHGVQLYNEVRPQIILTETNMPKMDGIQMIREIRSIDASVHFLVLSACRIFEYARQAISLRAGAYLLKDEADPHTILDALLEIKEKIRKEAEVARYSINDLVLLFVKGVKRDLGDALSTLNDLFQTHAIETEGCGVDSLAEQLSCLIEKTYLEHGRIELFTKPKDSRKETLHLWLQEQLRVIYLMDSDKTETT